MNAKPKPTLRRVREYTESLLAAYRDRANRAAERGDTENEATYDAIAGVLRKLLEVME